MTDEPKTGGLAKATPATREIVLRSRDEYLAYVSTLDESKYFVLAPIIDIGRLPVDFTLIPSAVRVNPDPAVGEVYADPLFCRGEEVALAKPALRRIAVAGGCDVDPTRIDSGTVPNLWAFKATLTSIGLDGRRHTHSESAEYDLRDGSPRVNKMIAAAKRQGKTADAQIESARLHGYRGGESRAIHAAIRGKFALRQKYTQSELKAKAFMLFNVVYEPDKSDPEIRRMYAQANILGTATLNPDRELPPAFEPTSHAPKDESKVIDGTVVGSEAQASTGAPSRSSTPERRPFDLAPPRAKTTLIVVKNVERGTTDADGFFISAADGREFHTMSHEIASACAAAKNAGTPIEVEPDPRIEREDGAIAIREIGGGKF